MAMFPNQLFGPFVSFPASPTARADASSFPSAGFELLARLLGPLRYTSMASAWSLDFLTPPSFKLRWTYPHVVVTFISPPLPVFLAWLTLTSPLPTTRASFVCKDIALSSRPVRSI
jgi:hypothetical protein